MNRFSLLSLLLLVTSVSVAQKAFIYNTLQKNGFVSVSAGLSQPLGDFGKKTGETRSGMALRGQSIHVSAGYRMAGPLGLMARYEQTAHGIDPSAMLSQYSQLPGDYLSVSAAAGRAGQWQTSSVMAGPYITIPFGRMAIDLRALAGQVWATCPETSVRGKLNRTETIIRTDNREAKAIIGGLGVTARYRITPILAIHVNSDYNSASFIFADIPLESQLGSRTQQTTFTSKKSLETLNVSIGLTIQFRARNYVF